MISLLRKSILKRICVLLVTTVLATNILTVQAKKPGPPTGTWRKILYYVDKYNLDFAVAGLIFGALTVRAIQKVVRARRIYHPLPQRRRGRQRLNQPRHQDFALDIEHNTESVQEIYAHVFIRNFGVDHEQAMHLAQQLIDNEIEVIDVEGRPQIVPVEHEVLPEAEEDKNFGEFTLDKLKELWGDGQIAGVKRRFAQHMGQSVASIRDEDVRWIGAIVTASTDEEAELCSLCKSTYQEAVSAGVKIAVLPCGHMVHGDKVENFQGYSDFCGGINQIVGHICPQDRKPFVTVKIFKLVAPEPQE